MNHIVYSKNPLKQVILQLNYLPMLEIGATSPVAFQNEVTSLFPLYIPGKEQNVTLNMGQNLDNPIIQRNENLTHIFQTEDRVSNITLTNSFITVSTSQYTKWKDFFTLFNKSFEALCKAYNINSFIRVGLRYIDAISKKEVNLENTPWTELINTPWTGVLEEIDEKQCSVSSVDSEFVLEDYIREKIHTGLGKLTNDNEVRFIIDEDFVFLNKINKSDVLSICTKLHSYSYNSFRSKISDKLHNAMNPITEEINE